MRKNFGTAELLDGTVLGPVRVLFADKMRFEKSARANGWNATEDVRVQGFLTWSALERSGTTELGYDAFLEQLADVDFEMKDGESEGDPTPADPSA